MVKKKLASNELRVINIAQDAIVEWLFESMMEHGTRFFDVKDLETVEFHCAFDRVNSLFTCAVLKNSDKSISQRDFELDWDEVRKAAGITASSLFFGPENKKLYKSLNYQKIPKLLIKAQD